MASIQNKILLISGTGFLGSTLLQHLTSYGLQIFPTSRKLQNKFIPLDLQKNIPTQLNITLKEQIFSHAIICAAQPDVEECFRKPKLSNRINVESLIEILSLFKEENIKPIFFSSDLVFDNLKGFYSELDYPNPTTLYGKQKWLIEEKIKATFNDFIIFRTSKLMSMNLHPKSILTKIMTELKNGHEIQAFQDQFISPVFIEDIAKIVFESLNANLNGIYHLAGCEVLSRLQLAKLVCNKMNIDSKIIKAITMQERTFSEPRGSQ